jgi:hypothetical protein
VIERTWVKNDLIELHLPMPVRRVIANAKVTNDKDKVVIERGPIVYCLEGIDNGGDVSNMELPGAAKLKATFYPDLLGGIEVITGEGMVIFPSVKSHIMKTKHAIKAIPYYSWSNRGINEMEVWISNKSTGVSNGAK